MQPSSGRGDLGETVAHSIHHCAIWHTPLGGVLVRLALHANGAVEAAAAASAHAAVVHATKHGCFFDDLPVSAANPVEAGSNARVSGPAGVGPVNVVVWPIAPDAPLTEPGAGYLPGRPALRAVGVTANGSAGRRGCSRGQIGVVGADPSQGLGGSQGGRNQYH